MEAKAKLDRTEMSSVFLKEMDDLLKEWSGRVEGAEDTPEFHVCRAISAMENRTADMLKDVRRMSDGRGSSDDPDIQETLDGCDALVGNAMRMLDDISMQAVFADRMLEGHSTQYALVACHAAIGVRMTLASYARDMLRIREAVLKAAEQPATEEGEERWDPTRTWPSCIWRAPRACSRV